MHLINTRARELNHWHFDCDKLYHVKYKGCLHMCISVDVASVIN